jgi:hypothetical protein
MIESKEFGVVFEAMLREAVTANFRSKMDAMPSEDEIMKEHPLSDGHNRRMDALFAMERRQAVTRKMFVNAKAAVIFICVTATLTFALMMTNPEVRAAVRNAVVSFYEGFTRVEFEEPHNDEKEAQGFSPRHIPHGFELTHSEILGFNYLAIYENADGNIIILDIGPPDAINVDNDEHTYYEETHDGVIYHIHEALDEDKFTSVMWTNKGFMFSLKGNARKEEFMDMARSMEYTG